nr:zinc finger, CCHC-type [Tanacetum cinerariifolium]
MEVEFMALASCYNEAELLWDLLINITLWPKPMPLILMHCDSQSTLSRVYNQVYNGRLSRLISIPGKKHWDAVNRVFKYLKQTMDYGLEYSGDPSVLEGYTDASWISDQEDYASKSGWIFTLGGGAVSLGSEKQSCLADSTMAVEFMALASCCKEAELIWDLLINITLWPKPMPLVFMHCDSQSTLLRAYNQVYNGKSRHIGLRHKRVNHLINDGVITVSFLRSSKNLTGPFTKGIPRKLIESNWQGMGLKPMYK